MPEEREQSWTIRGLMKAAIDHLQKSGIDNARLNVELLLSHALELPRITLYTSFERPVTRDEVRRFRSLYERRLKHEPLQYIVGSASFMGLAIQVDPRVLIPRPETESLIEQVMMRCGERSGADPVGILEVGTGSGNIAVALAKYIKNISVCSIDISEEALAVARVNAGAHGVDTLIEFQRIDFFEPVDQLLRRRFDMLVSNPPYIARDEWETLQEEVRGHEPAGALTDGNDGLNFYRRIGELAPLLLNDNGSVFVEVGFGQAEIVRQMFEDTGITGLTITRDLDGVPRVVCGQCRARARNTAMNN
ncbi:MAG: peptide chain release factor N(5)-glutamine methyltransferase [Bacteroidetes bacterium]|jgi:release factor glutamine methyltransferase|nr:peptide chain release factor N(5)-glutamine methyltransferase [Bacteroidota bacterium]